MSIPAEVRSEVELHFGPLRVVAAVGGGSLHPAHRVATASGDLFLKYGRATGPGFFAAEAEGLRQLEAAGSGLRIPAVRRYSDAEESRPHGWLALEWLEPGRPDRAFARRLAEGMATLHAIPRRGWGWERDGYIGTLPQRNGVVESWPGFWRIRRLEPQLALARGAGRLPATEREWDLLLDRLPTLLSAADEEGPSLLHGDLWSGNILATAAGEAAIVDPSVYLGHREVDLAMSELFGGFHPEFHDLYSRLRPFRPGYSEIRRSVYQLYYLLVHVNLFGEGYVARTAALLRSVLSSR